MGELITKDIKINPIIVTNDEMVLFEQRMGFVREELKDNPYIEETIRVLPVGGFRSAIGSIWNAVVDDLRNKILFRSIKLFNKEMNPKKEIKRYEDFQDNVTDEMLLEGAYKIGVIGWEAHKILKQAKDTRHIFDGHPRSSNPGGIKALSMIEDCIKYMLSQEYPPQIIDIDEYIDIMGTDKFYRNEYSVSDAICDLPDVYKNELANRLFSSYINEQCSTVLRSNIEFVSPILWKVLPRPVVLQICRRVDTEVQNGNKVSSSYAFSFINKVGAKKYLSTSAKKYLLSPNVEQLLTNYDTFRVANECVDVLYQYAGFIPREMLSDYITGLTLTYVGHIGGSAQYSRTDFYADGAALKIPDMFEKFDDESVDVFVSIVKSNKTLSSRIRYNVKLRRLRNLGEICYKHISPNFTNIDFIEALLDEKREKEFFEMIK